MKKLLCVVFFLAGCEDPVERVAFTLDKKDCDFGECRMTLEGGTRITVDGPVSAQDCVTNDALGGGFHVTDCSRVIAKAKEEAAQKALAEKQQTEAKAQQAKEPRESPAP